MQILADISDHMFYPFRRLSLSEKSMRARIARKRMEIVYRLRICNIRVRDAEDIPKEFV